MGARAVDQPGETGTHADAHDGGSNTLAGILNGLDYYADGLTIDRMGMADIAAQDIVAYAHDGPP